MAPVLTNVNMNDLHCSAHAHFLIHARLTSTLSHSFGIRHYHGFAFEITKGGL